MNEIIYLQKIEKYLPEHIKAVQSTKHKIIWCCGK